MSLHNFDLGEIARYLEGLEESIIHKLLDRAQFGRNLYVYQGASSKFEGHEDLSLFDVRLLMQENMDAQFGRFEVPEERPFTKIMQKPKRLVTGLPEFPIDHFESISCALEIKISYQKLIGKLCRVQDDGHYGSSVEHDVYALQAISRRVHFGGLYVSESKYLQKPDQFDELVKRNDDEGILELLTRREVEVKIYERVAEKVASIQERVNESARVRVDPEVIVDFYRSSIIPITKKSEILYFKARKSHA